jgi:hypothetical protein
MNNSGVTKAIPKLLPVVGFTAYCLLADLGASCSYQGIELQG